MLLTNIYHVIFDAIDGISVVIDAIDGIDGISVVIDGIDGKGTLGRKNYIEIAASARQSRVGVVRLFLIIDSNIDDAPRSLLAVIVVPIIPAVVMFNPIDPIDPIVGNGVG